MAKISDIDAFMAANEPRSTSNNMNKAAKQREAMKTNMMEMLAGRPVSPGAMGARKGAPKGAQKTDQITPTPSNSGQFTDGKGNAVNMQAKMRDKKIFSEGIKIGQQQIMAQLQQMRQQRGGMPGGGMQMR